MKYDSNNHKRRSIRLDEYDYSRAGAYFVTICTKNRACLFGDALDGEIRLNDAGRMVQSIWNELPFRFNDIELDAFVAMPNHIHGVIILSNREDHTKHHATPNDCESIRRGESCIRPERNGVKKIKGDHEDRPYGDNRVRGTLPGTLGRIVQAFKSITTQEYIRGVEKFGWPRFSKKLWQRNYYEHIIRNDDELNRAREYIANNPRRWQRDRENPDVQRGRPLRSPGNPERPNKS